MAKSNEGSYYFHRSNWTIDTLPPQSGDIRVPTAAVFVLAPLMGATFVVFLPVIGFWMVGKGLYHVFKKSPKPEGAVEKHA